MISNVNGVLSHLGVRFPETSGEAYRNVRWKCLMGTHFFELVLSVSLGGLGLLFERINCFTDLKGIVGQTLCMPLGDGGEGTRLALAPTIMSSLVASGTGSLGRSDSQDYRLLLSTMLGLHSGLVCAITVVKMIKVCRNVQGEFCRFPLIDIQDGVLMMASGLSAGSNTFMTIYHLGTGGKDSGMFDDFSPLVLLSSMLYLTHAGLLVLSAVCANRPVQRCIVTTSLKQIEEGNGSEPEVENTSVINLGGSSLVLV